MRGDVRVASWSRSGTDARADGRDEYRARDNDRETCALIQMDNPSRRSSRYCSLMTVRCSRSCAGCGLMGRLAVVESVRSELGGPAELTLNSLTRSPISTCQTRRIQSLPSHTTSEESVYCTKLHCYLETIMVHYHNYLRPYADAECRPRGLFFSSHVHHPITNHRQTHLPTQPFRHSIFHARPQPHH